MKQTPDELVNAWNKVFPIGTEVTRYRLVKPLREPQETITRSGAWVMGGHSAMVMVKGIAGGVLLESVIPKSTSEAGSGTKSVAASTDSAVPKKESVSKFDPRLDPEEPMPTGVIIKAVKNSTPVPHDCLQEKALRFVKEMSNSFGFPVNNEGDEQFMQILSATKKLLTGVVHPDTEEKTDLDTKH